MPVRSLHWSVHPNGRLEVHVCVDAVELRGVEDGAVIAGGEDAPGAVVRPWLCALRAWPLVRICCVSANSAYPAAIRGDLMRCADPERIATLAADHRNFGRQLPRERMCGAKDRTCLPACGWERVIDFNG